MLKSNFLRAIKKIFFWNKEVYIGQAAFLFRIIMLSACTIIWLYFIIVSSEQYPNFSLYSYAILVFIWIALSFIQVVKRGKHIANSFAINTGIVHLMLNCIPVSTVISMWSWVLFKIDYLTLNVSSYILYFLIQSIFFIILGIIPWKNGAPEPLYVSENNTQSDEKSLTYLIFIISSIFSWILIAIYLK